MIKVPSKKDLDINILIEEYLKKGASTRSVEKVLLDKYNIKISYVTIFNYLSNSGNQEVLEKIKDNKNITAYDIDTLCQEYLSGETITSLAKKYNYQEKPIYNALLNSDNIEVIIEFIKRNEFKGKQFRDKTRNIVCILKCLHCKEKMIVKGKIYSHKYCKCGANLIFFCTPNFLNCKIIYKSKYMRKNLIRSYDEFR